MPSPVQGNWNSSLAEETGDNYDGTSPNPGEIGKASKEKIIPKLRLNRWIEVSLSMEWEEQEEGFPGKRNNRRQEKSMARSKMALLQAWLEQEYRTNERNK